MERFSVSHDTLINLTLPLLTSTYR